MGRRHPETSNDRAGEKKERGRPGYITHRRTAIRRGKNAQDHSVLWKRRAERETASITDYYTNSEDEEKMEFASPRVRRNNRLIIFTLFILFICTFGDKTKQDEHKQEKVKTPYAFSYDIDDAYQGNKFQQEEESDGELVVGSYSVQLPDGRTQTVRYKADHKKGFTAEVSYYGEAKYAPRSEDPPFIAKPNSYSSEPASPYKKDDANSPQGPVQPIVAYKQEGMGKKVIKMEPIYLQSSKKDQKAHASNLVYDTHPPQTSDMFITADKHYSKPQYRDDGFTQDITYGHPQEKQQNINNHMLPLESNDNISVDFLRHPKSQVENYNIYSFFSETSERPEVQNHDKRNETSDVPQESNNYEEITQTVTDSNNTLEQQNIKKVEPHSDSEIQVKVVSSLESKATEKSVTVTPTYGEDDVVTQKSNSEKEASKNRHQEEPTEEKTLQVMKKNQDSVTSDPHNTKQLNKPKRFVAKTIRPQSIKIKKRRKDLKEQSRENPAGPVHVKISSNLEGSTDKVPA